MSWFNFWRRAEVVDPYTRAGRKCTVDSVRDGVVTIEGEMYGPFTKTFVQPGQRVKPGQAIGKGSPAQG